jgi:hypothetical protein
MSSSRRASDNTPPPVFWFDAILRKAYAGVLLLSLVFGALSIVGLARWPHGARAAPITCAVLSLAANQRVRCATRQSGVVLLGLVNLVLVIAVGWLAEVAVHVVR